MKYEYSEVIYFNFNVEYECVDYKYMVQTEVILAATTSNVDIQRYYSFSYSMKYRYWEGLDSVSA